MIIKRVWGAPYARNRPVTGIIMHVNWREMYTKHVGIDTGVS